MPRKKNSKWYAYDDEGEDFNEKKKRADRKSQRRLDRALKIKDVTAFIEDEELKHANLYVPRR